MSLTRHGTVVMMILTMENKGEGMKSALEIALEKTKDIKAEETAYIPEELKVKVREINQEYDAKVAEVETIFRSRLKEMTEQHGPQEVQAHMETFYAQLRQEKDRINEDRRDAVDKVLKSSK